MWLQRPAKFQPTLQRRITSSILRNNNDSSKRWCHSMSNEMFKTVIPNVFYVMHILKLTFILNFALIGRYQLTNQILQWESVMYISSSTICCCAYFNLSRFKLSVNTWPLSVSKKAKNDHCYALEHRLVVILKKLVIFWDVPRRILEARKR